MVRIPGFHPGDPGSSPGMGISMDTQVWSKGYDSSSYASRFEGSNPSSCIWFRGVMVSTQDFESCDPGSIPGETFFYLFIFYFIFFFKKNLNYFL